MIVPPLVLVEGDDVMFYPTQEALESNIEAVDARAQVFSVYDAEGSQLELHVYRGMGTGGVPIDLVSVREPASVQRSEIKLRQLVERFLKSLGKWNDQLESLPTRKVIEWATPVMGA